MKSKSKLMLYTIIIAIILIAISVILQRKLINDIPKITVYKLTRELSIGSNVTDDDLIECKIDIKENTDNYIKSKTEIKDKIVKEKLYKDELLNKNRLVSKSDQNIFISDKDDRRFSIPMNFIDDIYSLTLRKGDVVDIIFTELSEGNGRVQSKVSLEGARIIGAVDSNGVFLRENDKEKLAQAIIFESTTDKILKVTQDQYKGKFKFAKVPDNK